MIRTNVNVMSVLVLVCVLSCSVSAPLRNCRKPLFKNGDVVLKNRNRTVKYRCNIGFKLFGDKTATCLRGVWEFDNQMPVCTRSGCYNAPQPDNGQTHNVPDFRGAVVSFSCDPGYSMTGSPAAFCNGVRWNTTAPTCTPAATLPVVAETTAGETAEGETTTWEATTIAETITVPTTTAVTTTASTSTVAPTTAEMTKVTTITVATTKTSTTKASSTKASTTKTASTKASSTKASTTKTASTKTSKTKTANTTAGMRKTTTTTASATSARTECDFEEADLCGWSHAADQHFEWTRHGGTTPSNGVQTGPSWDHTKGRTGAGHYMYTESSSPRQENDTARLVSPVFDASLSSDACLVFYYHMFGPTIGSLNLYVKPVMQSLRPKIFTLKGQQGDKWVRAFARIEPLKVNFQLVFEAVLGSNYLGDMAIDDVHLTNGSDCKAEVNATEAPSFDADASRSCRGRCVEPPPQQDDDATVEAQSANATLALAACHCSLACTAAGTCCEDVDDYCQEDNKVQVAPQVAESHSYSKLALYSALVAGTCVVLAAVAATIVLLVRRRRSAYRRNNVDDDSEVRFLTADESLDFKLRLAYDD